MNVTSGQIKQILQLIDDHGTESEKIQKLLGGHLSDLLNSKSKATEIDREMWKGLLGLEFQVKEDNTLHISKTASSFEASFRSFRASGSTPDEAIGNLIREACDRFGLGVRWHDDPLTNDHRKQHPEQFPDYWEISITSDYSPFYKKSYGPFPTFGEAAQHLSKKQWSLNANRLETETDLWFGRVDKYFPINAIIRQVHFRDQGYLNNPETLPQGWQV